MGEWYQKHWAFPGLSVCRMGWPDGMGCPSVYRLRLWRIWFQSNLDQYLVASLDINRKLTCKKSNCLIAWMVFGVANDEYVKDLLRWRRIVFHIHTTYLKQILVPASYSPLALKDDPSHRYVSTASEGLNPICILKMVNDPKLQCYWVGFAPSQIRFFLFSHDHCRW